MPTIIKDLEQGREKWFLARCGIVTASNFGEIMATGRGGGESKTRQTYMLKILGEQLTGKPADNWSGNAHTERGHYDEPIARILYESQSGNEVEQVGIIISDCKKIGYSPDGICGQYGLVEIKSKMAHLHIDMLLKQEIPPEHMPQLQGGLMVSEREWIDFVSYSEGLPMFVKRVHRDETYINKLRDAIEVFYDEMEKLKQKIKAM